MLPKVAKLLISWCIMCKLCRLWSNFESGGGAHNASEVSMRAGIAPEEGKGVGGGSPLRRCGKILKSKTLKYAFLATLYHFTALLPCFTTKLKKTDYKTVPIIELHNC